jgi:hypothetical protein
MCIEDEITRKVITGLVDGSKLPPVEQDFRILYEVATFHFYKIRKKLKKKCVYKLAPYESCCAKY